MVRSDPCLLVETSVAYRLHGGLSQPRGELRNPGDLALLTHSLNWLYTYNKVYNLHLTTFYRHDHNNREAKQTAYVCHCSIFLLLETFGCDFLACKIVLFS